jgi:predicted phosphodiesterase
MRYGILADIHGNLEALQTVFGLYKEESIEDFLCLGDIVGYGANPKECLDIIREMKAVCVAGNHDWAVSGRLDPAYFNPAAKEAVFWTQKQLSSKDIDFLKNLELIFKNDDLILAHGTLSEPEHFHYMLSMSQAYETFCLMDRNTCFIGHSHCPQIIIQGGEEIRCSDMLKAEVDSGHKYIINVGSVGQPRDGNSMAAYCVYDTEAHAVEVRRTPYDIKTAQKKILAAGLPVSLAARLAIGH